MNRDFHHLRVNYNQFQLLEEGISQNPLDLFQEWFDKALLDQVEEPNAMVLSTIGLEGFPNARVVLLKELKEEGFVFFSNYGSEKGKELNLNNKASLVFNWLVHHRQIRIQGEVSKISIQESELYFKSRPYVSQIGAWASSQSEIIGSRLELENTYNEYEKKFSEGQVPMPPFWGGYCLKPIRIEFWQGREGRLHDRIVFEESGNSWKMKRLAP